MKVDGFGDGGDLLHRQVNVTRAGARIALAPLLAPLLTKIIGSHESLPGASNAEHVNIVPLNMEESTIARLSDFALGSSWTV